MVSLISLHRVRLIQNVEMLPVNLFNVAVKYDSRLSIQKSEVACYDIQFGKRKKLGIRRNIGECREKLLVGMNS